MAIPVGEATTGEGCQSLASIARPRPTFAAAPLLPERGASTTDSAPLPIDDGPDAAMGQRRASRVGGQSPEKEVVWFERPQKASVSTLHLLANLLAERLLLLLSFFCLRLSLEGIAQTQFCSHAVNLTDTHAKLKAILQCSLKHATRGMRSLLALWRRERFVPLHAVSRDVHVAHPVKQCSLWYGQHEGGGMPWLASPASLWLLLPPATTDPQASQ